MANNIGSSKHIELVTGANIGASIGQFKADLKNIKKALDQNPVKVKLTADTQSIQKIKSDLENALSNIKVGKGSNQGGGGPGGPGNPGGSGGSNIKNKRLSATYYGLTKSYVSDNFWKSKSQTKNMIEGSTAYNEYKNRADDFKALINDLKNNIGDNLGADGLFLDSSNAVVNLEQYEDKIWDAVRALQAMREAKRAAEVDVKEARVGFNQSTSRNKVSIKVNDYFNSVKDKVDLNNEKSWGYKLKQLADGLSNGSLDISDQEAMSRFTEIQSKLKHLGIEADTTGDKLSRMLKDRVTNAAITAILNGLRLVMKQVIQTVEELDAATVNLQIATGYSREQTKDLIGDYSKLAKQLGVTTVEIANAADAWLRQGYSAEQSAMLVKNSMMLAKLGQIDSAEATTALTSAMKGYNLSAQDTEGIVDKLVAVDMIAATSAGDLAIAMAETNTSAKIAGVSMDTLIGYIASVAEVTQDGAESVGTFYKTLFARMGNVKAGRLIDPETSEDLSNVETTLRGVGIELRTETGEFRNFADVIDEVHQKWDDYSSTQKHAIAVAFAGTRQQEKFLTLMEHYGEAMEYADEAANSAGTAVSKYNAAYKNSVEAAKAEMTASFEQFSQYVLDSDFLRDFYKTLADIVAILPNAIDGIGGIGGAIGILASGLVAFKADDINDFLNSFKPDKDGSLDKTNALGKSYHNLSQAFKAARAGGDGFFKSLKTGIKTMSESMTAAEKASLILLAITVAVAAFSKIYEKTAKSIEKSKEAVADASGEYDSLVSEIEGTENRLSQISERIAEINSNPLTLTSQKELSLLQAESAELRAQNVLLAAQLQMKKDAEISASKDAIERSRDIGFWGENAYDANTGEKLTEFEGLLHTVFRNGAISQLYRGYENISYGVERFNEYMNEGANFFDAVGAAFRDADEYSHNSSTSLLEAVSIARDEYNVAKSEYNNAVANNSLTDEITNNYQEAAGALSNLYNEVVALGPAGEGLATDIAMSFMTVAEKGAYASDMIQALFAQEKPNMEFDINWVVNQFNSPDGNPIIKAIIQHLIDNGFVDANLIGDSKIDVGEIEFLFTGEIIISPARVDALSGMLDGGLNPNEITDIRANYMDDILAMVQSDNEEYQRIAQEIINAINGVEDVDIGEFIKNRTINYVVDGDGKLDSFTNFYRNELAEYGFDKGLYSEGEGGIYGLNEEGERFAEEFEAALASLSEEEIYAAMASENFVEQVLLIAEANKEAEESTHSLAGAIGNLAKQQNALSKVGDIGAKIVDGEDIGFSDIESLLSELTGVGVDSDTAMSLVNGLISAETASEQTDALNDITNAIIATTVASWDLANASAEEIEMYESLLAMQLKEVGVVNAESIAHEILQSAINGTYQSAQELAVQKEYAALKSEELADATYDEVYRMYTEETASEVTRAALARLALEKLLLNATEINTIDDIENLIALANAALLGTQALDDLYKAKDLYDRADSVSTANPELADRMRDRADKIIDGVRADYEPIDPNEFIYSGGDTGGAGAKEETEWEKVRKSIDDRVKYLEGQRARGLISEEEFNKQRKAIYEEGYAEIQEIINNGNYSEEDKSELLDSEVEFIEDIKDAHTAAFESEKSELEHQLAMNLITEEQYLIELRKLYDEYYKDQAWYSEEAKEIEEELYNKQNEIIDKWANAAADAIKSISQAAEDAVSSITTLIESSIDTHDENFNLDKSLLDHALAMNFISEKEYYASLEDLYKKYYKDKYIYMEQFWENQEEIYKHEQETLEDSASAVEDIHARVVEMIKSELEEAIDSIEETREAYLDLIEIRRKALNEQKDEEDYNRSREEQLDNISELQRQLNALSRDTSAEGMRMYQEISEELKKAQDALAEFDRDYSYDQMNKQLDNEADILEDNLDKEVGTLEDLLDDNEYLVEEAWRRMGDLSGDLFAQLEEYTKKHSTSIKDEITDTWETATDGVKGYADAYNAYLGITEQIGQPGMTEGEFNQFGGYIDLKQTFNWAEVGMEFASSMLQVGTTLLGDFAGILDSIFDTPLTNLINIGAGTIGSFAGSGASILTSVFGLLGGFAEGTDFVPKTGYYLTDELGEELKLIKSPTGANYTLLTRGSKVITNEATERLMRIINNPDLLLNGRTPEINISAVDTSMPAASNTNNQTVVIHNTFDIKSNNPRDVANEIERLMPKIADYTINNLVGGTSNVGVKRRAQQLR